MSTRWTTAGAAIALALVAGCSANPDPVSQDTRVAATAPAPTVSTSSASVRVVPSTGAINTAGTTPTARPGQVRGSGPTQVNARDAGSVAQAYLRAVSTWDTRVDRHPSDAGARAARFTSGALRQSLLAPQRGGGAGRFLAAVSEGRGYQSVVSLTAIDGDAPGVSGSTASLGYEVTTRVVDGSGKRPVLPDESLIYNVHLARTSGGTWTVTRQEMS